MFYSQSPKPINIISVTRCVKYSGFGNFSGFLARRGLMGDKHGRRKRQSDLQVASGDGSSSASKYAVASDIESSPSSSSSDSETEAYHALKNGVNLVTGRWEPPKANPLDNMSEEQKEYEVMNLVNAIDKLQRYAHLIILTPHKKFEYSFYEHYYL
ncbi:unnamed protein product [Protopolystoma xenopodis]|uniref:Uncharacterized protein n=1 Tax=Protopolystoma xenopodis TaxID=117903 RepID=A0A448X3K8_9PLAT|nr:unnamed protein product [Protopolystoma xenopodis]